MKKEQEKKNIIAKVNYKNSNNTKYNNEGKVQNLIKDIKDNQKIDTMLSKDLSDQQKHIIENIKHSEFI